MQEASRFGYVAIVGRPNVGKSTLLNALVGEKISIVSAKPHTTRQRILGVLNQGQGQAVFVDTPGLAPRGKRVLHRLMSKAIHQALEEADLVLMVIEAGRFTAEDRELAELLAEKRGRTMLVINKIDALGRRDELLPILAELASRRDFATFVPVSAAKGDNLPALTGEIFAHLPPGAPLFPPDMRTDRDLKFRMAEIIREKLLALLHEEVPYGLTVEIQHAGDDEEGRRIVHAVIWLERKTHKAIVIGKGGRVLKQAGRAARIELSALLDVRVHLELWVKVREHWSDSERELSRLGFDVQ